MHIMHIIYRYNKLNIEIKSSRTNIDENNLTKQFILSFRTGICKGKILEK